MTPTPSSLRHLGLARDATAQDVRRAYAQQLKQIDQDTQPEEFQRLREAYAHALEWCSAPLDEKPEGELATLDKPAIAALLHDTFAREVFEDPASAQATLTELLDDPRLVDLETREYFERLCVEQLAAGWRPGHEFAFDAAVIAFGWDVDQGRLLPFGPAGDLLLNALVERDQFEEQSPQVLPLQIDLMQRVRSGVQPSDADVMRTRRVLDWLSLNYPRWRRVTVGGDNLRRWEAWHDGLPKKRQSIDAPHPEAIYPPEWLGEARKPKATKGAAGPLIVFLYFLACLIGGLVLAAWLNRGCDGASPHR